MKINEIKLNDLNTKKFIEEQVNAISSAVGDGLAINALSGGVDSSTVTLLGHKAISKRLKTYFIDNGIMRQGEPEYIASIFRGLAFQLRL